VYIAFSRLLNPLSDVPELDTVWVLWVPDHLSLWSRRHGRWSDLLFTGMNKNELLAPSVLSVLQDAEQDFLDRIGASDASPYLYELVSGSEDSQ
jgi:hypothetical protein